MRNAKGHPDTSHPEYPKAASYLDHNGIQVFKSPSPEEYQAFYSKFPEFCIDDEEDDECEHSDFIDHGICGDCGEVVDSGSDWDDYNDR